MRALSIAGIIGALIGLINFAGSWPSDDWTNEEALAATAQIMGSMMGAMGLVYFVRWISRRQPPRA